MRLHDRFYDLYVQVPMQKIVTDRLRPAGKNDPHGVEQARALLQTSLGMVEQDMAGKTWAVGGHLHHGGLRGRAGAVLCRQGDAA